jgi:hypothetical protein
VQLFRTHFKDFARICEPLNKASRTDAEYLKGPIIGKGLEAFTILNLMLCSESISAYVRSYRTYALIVDLLMGIDSVEGGMAPILTQIDKKWQVLHNHICHKAID